MPSDSAEGVADESVATTRTPAEGTEVPVAAEDVDNLNPSTAVAAAEGSSSWADLSEVSAPASSSAAPVLGPVKEEVDEELQINEALKLSAVLATIGLVDEVADDPVATEEAAPEPELDLSIFD